MHVCFYAGYLVYVLNSSFKVMTRHVGFVDLFVIYNLEILVKMKVTLGQVNGLDQHWNMYRNGITTFSSYLVIYLTLTCSNPCGTLLVAWSSHLRAKDLGWSLMATTKSKKYLSSIVTPSPPITRGTLYRFIQSTT